MCSSDLIKDGKCIDTSMGLTPLEGLVMGTRSGDIDAGAVTFIMEKEGLNATGISNLLNKKSGVLGVSGVSSDMRERTGDGWLKSLHFSEPVSAFSVSVLLRR